MLNEKCKRQTAVWVNVQKEEINLHQVLSFDPDYIAKHGENAKKIYAYISEETKQKIQNHIQIGTVWISASGAIRYY